MCLLAQALLWLSSRSRGKAEFCRSLQGSSRHRSVLTFPCSPYSSTRGPSGSPGTISPEPLPWLFPPPGCSSSGVHVAHSNISFKFFKLERHSLHVVSPDPHCKGNPSVLPDSILLLFPTKNLHNGLRVLGSYLQCDGLGRWGLGGDEVVRVEPGT